MIFNTSIGGFICRVLIVLLSFGVPKGILKMVNKEVQKVFDITTLQLEGVHLPNGISEELPAIISPENFYRLKQDDSLIGYVYLGKAPSKTANFDYLVIFNKELVVLQTKVLIYREEYGGEIGSKRWLKQFIGLSGKDRVDYKTNIDGIAGATISVRSMTLSMDKLFQSIGELQQKNIL
jgi:Na+-translocating ferredoxin:NAD+ oxidoreductase RnfG subunit